MTRQAERARYLVTGASGFIGRATCEELLRRNADVFGVSRSPADLNPPSWHHLQADLTDPGESERVLEEAAPDYVLHLASCVTGIRDLEWVEKTMAANLVAAVNILSASIRNDVRKVVLAGSLEEPDGIGDPVPSSPYAASKWAASGYARMFSALYELPTAVARIFMVYGPGQGDTRKLVPYVCLSALRGEPPQLMSGERPVDWIYVADVVDGLIRMTCAGPDDGSYVDIGSGNLVTTGKVAAKICQHASPGLEPELGAIPDRKLEQVRKADVERTAELLGWRPQVDLDEGLKRTLAAYRDHPECSEEGMN